MKRNAIHGFTLIELVVVIVILGILAAVAVPKFLNVQSSARNAVLNATCGAIQSAAVIAYASVKGPITHTQLQSAVTVSDSNVLYNGTAGITNLACPNNTLTYSGDASAGSVTCNLDASICPN